MTDKETESTENVAAQTDDLAENVSAESWQDELPPEDDFHDQAEVQEELIDDLIAESSAQSGEETASEGAKRGKVVMVASIVIGALLIGGLAYSQFGGGGEQPDDATRLLPVSKVMSVKEVRPTQPLPPAKQAPLVKATDPTGKVDMAVLFHQAQQQASGAGASALPLKDKETAPTEKPEAVEKMSELVINTGAAVPPPALPDDALVGLKTQKTAVEAEKKGPPSSPAPVALQTPSPVPQPAAVVEKEKTQDKAVDHAAADARFRDIAAQLEALRKDLERALQQNAALTARLDALGGEPSGVRSRKPEEKSVPATIAVDEPARAPLSDGAAVASPSSLVEDGHEGAKNPPQKKKAVSKKKAPAVKKTAQKPQTAPWVLRAATPDAAWVSAGVGAQDLRRVAVGEELSGIGRVKEIRQNGEKWEVVGDKGTLK